MDASLVGETGATNHRNARFPIRLLHCHNLGGDPGIDGNDERNSRPTALSLEKRG